MKKNKPFTILFVCTGNTCRSPAALSVANHLLYTTAVGKKLIGKVQFQSAGIELNPSSPYFIPNHDQNYLRFLAKIFLHKKITGTVDKKIIDQIYKTERNGGAMPLMVTTLKRQGITAIGNHRPRQLTEHILNQADLVLAMSAAHKEKIKQRFPTIKNVYTLIEYSNANSKKLSPDKVSIEDPIGRGAKVYEKTVRQIEVNVKKLFAKLNKNINYH